MIYVFVCFCKLLSYLLCLLQIYQSGLVVWVGGLEFWKIIIFCNSKNTFFNIPVNFINLFFLL